MLMYTMVITMVLLVLAHRSLGDQLSKIEQQEISDKGDDDDDQLLGEIDENIRASGFTKEYNSSDGKLSR